MSVFNPINSTIELEPEYPDVSITSVFENGDSLKKYVISIDDKDLTIYNTLSDKIDGKTLVTINKNQPDSVDEDGIVLNEIENFGNLKFNFDTKPEQMLKIAKIVATVLRDANKKTDRDALDIELIKKCNSLYNKPTTMNTFISRSNEVSNATKNAFNKLGRKVKDLGNSAMNQGKSLVTQLNQPGGSKSKKQRKTKSSRRTKKRV
jgi:hypothetical protein